jgi:Sec-independent protein secretion pathway component TatC
MNAPDKITRILIRVILVVLIFEIGLEVGRRLEREKRHAHSELRD